MKILYLKAWTGRLQRVYLFAWLCLLVPMAAQAQNLALQAAPNNTLPLQDFGNIPVGRVSAPQSFLLSGTSLTNDVTVTAPDGFKLRVGNGTYASMLTLTPSSGTLNATSIDVVFAPVASGTNSTGTGPYTGNIIAVTPTNSGSTTQSVAVSGTAPSGPYVSVDTAMLDFGQLSGSGSGQVRTFVVEGNNLGNTLLVLTPALTGSTASGNIQIRNMAVASNQFEPSLSIEPVNGQVPPITIQVRIVGPVASQSTFTGTITATSGAAVAAPNNVVQVTGNNAFTGSNSSSTFTVSTPPSPGFPGGGQPLLPFSTVPEKASASQTLLVSGSFLINNITVRAPANFQVSLDAAFTGLGSGTPGATTTANTISLVPVSGKVENVLVYIRYVPLVAGTESGTAINFSSSPATPIATTVAANSIGTIESRTIFVKPAPLVIGNNVKSAPQLIRIHAELIRNPARISVSGESTGAQGNPNGYAQFRISTDGVNYTDPASATANSIQLTPDPNTNIIDQDIYVIYAPSRVGAAQAVLQYYTSDVTATPANTITPIVSSFAGPTANQLRGTTIDFEPTRDTPFTAARNVGDASATITFQPDSKFSGYGEFHLVLVSTSSSLSVPDVMPQDGMDYTASSGVFQGAGQSTLADSYGNLYYVVFTGGAGQATITGLNSQTTYYAYVFDYNSTNLSDDGSGLPGTIFISNAENYKGPAQATVLGVALPGNAPLPVGLSAFTAQLQGPAVRVAWATASEKNNASFAVERSVAGQPYTTVGTVAGAGTSAAAHTYSLLDTKLPAGATLLYYRLRQTDLDGTSTYSPVRAINLAKATTEAPAQLLAYPNPAHEAVRVQLLGAGAAPLALEVYDASGRLVRTQAAPTSAAETVSLIGLPAGLYVLRCGKLSQRLQVK